MSRTPRSRSRTSGASSSSDAEAPAGNPFIEVAREHHHGSLFDCLDSHLGPLDRPAVRRAAESGLLLLNGEPAGPGVTLKLGDTIQLMLPPAALQRQSSFEVPILHRDGGLVVAAKPSGLPFDEGRSGGDNALRRIQEQCEGGRPRALHRLDRDTSGVCVVALDSDLAKDLTEAFAENRARVEYEAVVRGPLPGDEGEVDLPLGKGNRAAVALRPDPSHGRAAVTTWRVLERFTGFTRLVLQPSSGGRSHQVRAHLAALGNPALCDRDYHEDDQILLSQIKLHYRPKKGRPERPILARPALHAARFHLDDLLVEAPTPTDLELLLTQLRRLRPLG